MCKLLRKQNWDSPKWWYNLLEVKLHLKWNCIFWNLKCIVFFKLHFQFIQSYFSWNRVYFWNQIAFYSISAQQITLMPKWNHSIFFFFSKLRKGLIWPALSDLCSIHVYSRISSFFVQEGFFNSSHNVKLEPLEAAHWLYHPSESARNVLWGKKNA